MKLYNETGFFTEEGKKFVAETMGYEVRKLLEIATTKEEARILGSLLANYIGNMVSDKIQDLKK